MELLCAHPAAVDISRCGRQLHLHSLAFTFVLSMFHGSRLPDAEVPIAPFCCSAAMHSSDLKQSADRTGTICLSGCTHQKTAYVLR